MRIQDGTMKTTDLKLTNGPFLDPEVNSAMNTIKLVNEEFCYTTHECRIDIVHRTHNWTGKKQKKEQFENGMRNWKSLNQN